MFSLASLLSKSYTKIYGYIENFYSQTRKYNKVHIIIHVIVVMNISYHKIVLQYLL